MNNPLNLREGDYFRIDSPEQFDAVVELLTSNGIHFAPSRKDFIPDFKSMGGSVTTAIRMDSPSEYGRLFSEESIQNYGQRLIIPKYERKMIATLKPRDSIVIEGEVYDKEEVLQAIRNLHSTEVVQ